MPLSNEELLQILYARLLRLSTDRKVAVLMGDDAAVEAIDADTAATETRISNAGGPPWVPPGGPLV